MAIENIRATRVGLTFSQLGTFWTQSFKDPKQVRRLIQMLHQHPALQSFESTSNNLAGETTEAARVANVIVEFDPKCVKYGGDEFYDDPQLYYGTEQEFKSVYGGGNTPYYILDVEDVIPFSIQTPEKRLTVGIDFFIHKDKWIFFRENPRKIFKDNQFLVLAGRRPVVNWLAEYAVQAHADVTMKYITAYARNRQTPKALTLALASIAGLAILSSEQKLLTKQVEGPLVIYNFENEVWRVDYPHEHLEEGKTYPADHIIGDAIKVHIGGTTEPAWWRAIDWKGGLSLDPIIDFRGLFLKDEDVIAYAAGTDAGSEAGSKVHARLELTNNFDLERKYWEQVAADETAQGYYFNSVINLLTNQNVSLALVDDGGSGYAVDDTITLAGGKRTVPAVVRVTSVDTGVITSVSIEESGAYTALPDNSVLQDSTSGGGVGATFNITWEISPDPYAAALDELESINSLNKKLNLPEEPLNPKRLPHTKLVNPIDAFFLAVLNPRSFVITIDQAIVKHQAELFKFLSRELPIGVLAIIFAYSPRISVDCQTLTKSTDSVATADFDADAIQTVQDVFTLSDASHDFVKIRHENVLC